MDIHRCRFVSYNPQGINSVAFSHPPSADLAGRGVSTLRLAIGRANGDIDIWNPQRGAWFQETTMRGGKDRSIEGLTWIQDPADSTSRTPGKLRLFSIGSSSAVSEWDLAKGHPLRHSSGNYGEIWCIAAQPQWQQKKRGKDGKLLPPAEGEDITQSLAAGCVDGSIVILSTSDDDLKFQRLMRPSTKKARVLSVTFQNRNTIIAGYADSSIRVFDIRNGQQLRTISLGKGISGGPKEVLVWSVKCLPDGTIVSADSSGEIKFWDGKNYSLFQRISSHLADVLDIAVSADGETVVSGGADQRTVVYRKNGEKGDKKARWAELSHRRYHSHDVKTFAVYETKDVSFVVSGGPDATPVVLPLRAFGKEHHRKLSSLPQIPQLTSSPSSRLIMSFWGNEVSLWRVSRGPTSPHDSIEGQKHKLVAKVLIQGEESINSASLSSDGKLLVVATISDIKVFAVRRRKGDEKGGLRVTKIDVPASLSTDGARNVVISPDSRWLCVTRPSNDVYMARINPLSSTHEKPEILPRLAKLKRIQRHNRQEKVSHGTLGDYDRLIRSVVFSEDSKIIAIGDLSGCVDTWTLNSVTEPAVNGQPKSNGTTASDDESSDDEDDEGDVVIEGERWVHPRPDSSITRLKAGVAFLSFCPRGGAPTKAITNGNGHTADSATDDKLMVLTTEHQLIEYEARTGQLSDWSRRNPKAYLPDEFRGVKDRAMGCLWDVSEGRKRIWLYGTSWLWMFDIKQDFPSPEEVEAEEKLSLRKRKRDIVDEEFTDRKKTNSGAGDQIPKSQMDIHLGAKVRKIVGSDGSHGEWVALDPERPRVLGEDDEDYEYDEAFTAENETNLARLRRGEGPVGALQDAESKDKATTNGTPSKEIVMANGTSQPARRWWHTYKYRDILGIVPLSVQSGEGAQGESLEVAIIERPMWDVDLPGKYEKEYE